MVPDPWNGAPKAKMPPSEATSQYPPVAASVAMPTTGATSGRAPAEPWNPASPKAKMPPSEDTSQ